MLNCITTHLFIGVKKQCFLSTNWRAMSKPHFVAAGRGLVMFISAHHLRTVVESSRLMLGYETEPESGAHVGTLYPFCLVDEAPTLHELKRRFS